MGCRNSLVTDDEVDLARLGAQCLAALEKYSAPRAYELLLKKRAERHQWRLVKDDQLLRAVVRLCCFQRAQDSESWNNLRSIVEGMAESEKEILRSELGHKDGITDVPAFVPVGGAAFMSQVSQNAELGPKLGVQLLITIFQAAAKT